MEKTAPLQEIFSSVQGEGVYVGKRQVFVRFAHCHLKCAYCDTPMTSASGQCHVETVPGSGETVQYANPMPPETLVGVILQLLSTASHHSVSFTGGEPLLYHRFLQSVLPHVQQAAPVYMETSGTQPEFLESVLPWVDIIAMDIKLPSSTHEPPHFEEHARFYEKARTSKAETFIKLVFNAGITNAEIEAVKRIVTDVNTPLILQPETSLADRKVHIPSRCMLDVEAAFSRHFADVRLIPQTHKMLDVL